MKASKAPSNAATATRRSSEPTASAKAPLDQTLYTHRGAGGASGGAGRSFGEAREYVFFDPRRKHHAREGFLRRLPGGGSPGRPPPPRPPAPPNLPAGERDPRGHPTLFVGDVSQGSRHGRREEESQAGAEKRQGGHEERPPTLRSQARQPQSARRHSDEARPRPATGRPPCRRGSQRPGTGRTRRPRAARARAQPEAPSTRAGSASTAAERRPPPEEDEQRATPLKTFPTQKRRSENKERSTSGSLTRLSTKTKATSDRTEAASAPGVRDRSPIRASGPPLKRRPGRRCRRQRAGSRRRRSSAKHPRRGTR